MISLFAYILKCQFFLSLHCELFHSFLYLNSLFVFIHFIYIYITIMHGTLQFEWLHVHTVH